MNDVILAAIVGVGTFSVPCLIFIVGSFVLQRRVQTEMKSIEIWRLDF